MEYGNIHSIETFGTVDGPGIRYVIFFQGCPMRCKYCHNPDTWQVEAGKKMTVAELLAGYQKNKVFYKKGGITATGGEPLLQLAFLTELFEAAKKEGIHTCLDTSGITFDWNKKERFARLAKVTDYVLLDLKHADNEAHKSLTGWGNESVFAFLSFLEQEKVSVRIRHVLVPGITLNEDALYLLGQRLAPFSNIKELEVLPYHTMGLHKYEEMGMVYPLLGVTEPKKDEVKQAKEAIVRGLSEGRANLTKKV